MPEGYPSESRRARTEQAIPPGLERAAPGAHLPSAPGLPAVDTPRRPGRAFAKMRVRGLRRPVAGLLLAALSPLALDGCVSVGLSRSVAAVEGAGEVAVAVYRKSGDRDAGAPVSFPVLSELQKVEGRERTTVARSMAASWTVAEVPPGRYALRVARKIDENGDVVPLRKPYSRDFDVKAGERVEASVVLEKVPVGWIVLAAVTIVLLVVLAIELAEDADLPSPPPLPSPDLFLHVALALPWGSTSGSRTVEPGVADVFPAPGSVVAARRVAVSFLMSGPLDPAAVEDGAVLAVGSLSGEIPGEVTWQAGDQLLRFAPSRDFRPGEEVTVTLDLGKVESAEGRRGNGRTSTTFRVP